MLKKTFGEWIREYRENQGFDAVECAKRAGMKPQQWSDWETDRSRRKDGSPTQPRVETIQAIARGLMCPANIVAIAAGYPAIEQERDYAADDDVPKLIAFYNGLDASGKDELVAIAELKWKAQNKTTHGNKAE